MKNVISARDIEELLRRGGDIKTLPADAILTPSARDILRDLELNGKKATAAGKGGTEAGANNGSAPA